MLTAAMWRGGEAEEVHYSGFAGEHGTGTAVLEGEGQGGIFAILRIPPTAYEQGITAGGGGGGGEEKGSVTAYATAIYVMHVNDMSGCATCEWHVVVRVQHVNHYVV